jgi:hypothetical protein
MAIRITARPIKARFSVVQLFMAKLRIVRLVKAKHIIARPIESRLRTVQLVKG